MQQQYIKRTMMFMRIVNNSTANILSSFSYFSFESTGISLLIILLCIAWLFQTHSINSVSWQCVRQYIPKSGLGWEPIEYTNESFNIYITYKFVTGIQTKENTTVLHNKHAVVVRQHSHLYHNVLCILRI